LVATHKPVSAVGFEIADLHKFYNTLESPNDTIECEVAGLVVDYINLHTHDECTVKNIEKHVMESLDLSRYGLSAQEYSINSLACAKTYRLITGDLPGWSQDGRLTMDETK